MKSLGSVLHKLHPVEPRAKSQSGFSLVEILISLGVVTTFLFILGVIIQNGITINGKTSFRAEASSLAFKKVQDYINLDFSNVPIGDVVTSYEVEDFSAEAKALKLSNVVAKVYVEPESELKTTTTTTTTNFSQTTTADSTFISGSEISAVGVDDAANIYWNEGRISDDSFSNYTYNAFSPGADNKPLPSIDLGTAQVVDTIRIEWWTCNYGADDFRIEAKNGNATSNSGWTTIVSGLSDNNPSCSSSASAQQDVDVSANVTPYQHWRMFVVDATHSAWNVISEFEAFSDATGAPGDIVEQHGSDATDSPGDLYFSSSDLEMSEDGARGHQSVGVIFDDIDTPQGASIDNAYIEFTADQTDSGTVELKVVGVDEDTAVAWGGSYAVDNAVDGDNSDGRVGTTASTTWTPAAWTDGDSGANTRVDVTAIVQEIVDRAGWTVDNDMTFAVQYVSGAGRRVGSRDAAPELVIDWSESTTTTSTDPYEDVNVDGDVDNPNLVRITAIIEYDSYGRRDKVQFSTFMHRFGVGSD